MKHMFPGLTLVLAVALPAQSAAADLAARIDKLAADFVKTARVPGASLLVAVGESIIIEKGYGKANLENDIPVTPKSVFRIGSITKQFTAALILKLVDAGKLKLDDTLDQLLPEQSFPGKRITVRQLLNHTSGIKSYTALGPKFRSIRLKPLTHAEPFDFTPGTGWKYNNSGYYLLGVIIEKATGKKFEDVLQEQICKPLRLAQTRYGGAQPIVAHRARGYTRRGGEIANAPLMSMRTPFAAGALISTTRDLYRWNLALHGGKVLSASSYEKMITPVGKAKRLRNGYGFGVNAGTQGREPRIAHGGGILGFRAFLAYYPNRKVTVVVLINTDKARPNLLAARVADLVLQSPAKKRRTIR